MWGGVEGGVGGGGGRGGGGEGGGGGWGEGGGGGAGAKCAAKAGTGGGGNSGGGGAGDPCEEPCIGDPGWDVMVGDECCCPDRVCGYDDCYGGWQGVCTDGYWSFNHWDGSADPSCGQ